MHVYLLCSIFLLCIVTAVGLYYPKFLSIDCSLAKTVSNDLSGCVS